ncbi:MAG: FGGY-family carbohydrate kinase, partial [Defluviitaleaceae bacterium]|nr:FGGY-family carbohydrate kinase [Defluviitaleaceae bacterium]
IIGEEKIFEVCGNPMSPSYTLPKILWYKKHRPEVYAKTHKIMQSNGFIAQRLTGRFTQDVSQGYGLQCFDLRMGRFDEALCAEFGIDFKLLPELFPCGEIIGRVSGEAERACGLKKGTPVVAGGLDAACGTLGAGVSRETETQLQGGQAGGMSICVENYASSKKLITSFHVIPGRWLVQGGTVGGGGALKWFREHFACGASFDELTAEAATAPPGCGGLVFLPYMAGERSPIWDPDAKGIFYGLDYSKTRAHMIRAVLEGVAFSLRHNMEAAEAAGARAGELNAMGGASNSPLWMQIKSDVLGRRIQTRASDAATTLGAALLAGVAAKAYGSFYEAVAEAVRPGRVFEPNTKNFDAYEKNYRVYRGLYERLKGAF